MHKNNKPILLKNIRVIDASQNLDQEMNITVKNGIISYFENNKKIIHLMKRILDQSIAKIKFYPLAFLT